MTLDSQSELIVEIASAILGGACIVMAWGALSAWRSRPKNRIKRRADQGSPEALFLPDPPESSAGLLGPQSERPRS
jgi:hypothetical protein